MIDEHNSLNNLNLNSDSPSNDKKSHKILWASIGVVVLIIAGSIGYYKISHPNIISDQRNIDTTRAVFTSQETCESQTGFPCRFQMCAEDGTGICDNFEKGWSAVSSLYTVEEVLRNDRLKYRGASSEVTSPYLIRAYLVSKKTANCPPCLSPDPSLCGPCPLGQIILAPASNPKSTDTLMVGVIPGLEINNAIQKLELNNIYEFTLKPGQNHPELVSVAFGSKSVTQDVDLRNSDPGAGNQTIRPDITLREKLPDRFTVKAYLIKPDKNERGIITVHTDNLPLFVTLFDGGRIIATSRDTDENNNYIIRYDLGASKEYVLEVFINVNQIKSFNPDTSYQTTYSISYKK